jgi:hypothetical protein
MGFKPISTVFSEKDYPLAIFKNTSSMDAAL